MNNIILASATEMMMGMGIFGVLIAIVIGALYALFPLIVMWQLGGVKQRIDRQRLEEAKALKSVTEELRRQNELTRQLLRAYGHDPEA